MATKAKSELAGVTLKDRELSALSRSSNLLAGLCFDQKWRVLNYLIVRHLGRAWALPKPRGE